MQWMQKVCHVIAQAARSNTILAGDEFVPAQREVTRLAQQAGESLLELYAILMFINPA